jgi:hypothetical protein
MKIYNWCKKLSTALVAGGIMAPLPSYAAGLGVNLVSNPGFESVDTASPGVYNAVKILNWGDGSSTGFAYAYTQGYDFGGPLAGGGNYYFTSNQSGGDGTDVTAPGTISQLIDVSTGSTATAIAAGSATFNLSAFFTTYVKAGVPDGDIANIELRFVDASNTGISAVTLSNSSPLSPWAMYSTSGQVPVGTAKLFVSLYGTPVTNGPDGYIDNIVLQIKGVPEPSTVVLAGIGVAAAGLRVIRRRKKS